MQDYYRILEVHPEASQEVIGKAYRTLVVKYHPDHFHSSNKSRLEEKMKELNQAYEILNNPKLRAKYDTSYKTYQQHEAKVQPKRIMASRFQNIGYWFLLTVFLLFSGKTIIKLIAMLPIILKLCLIAGIALGIRHLLKNRLKK